jgi:LmbE family N-acetylglucosaminyl deacetylase
VEDLGKTRLEEWREAGKLLGATTLDYLGFKDGQLNNASMIKASEKTVARISDILQTAPENAIIEFITLDLNGFTGHIDHIVAARVASFAFYRLKQHDSRFDRIRYTCLPRSLIATPNTSWIFMEAGRDKNEVDEIVDTRDLKDDILTIMKTHRTQRGDFQEFITSQGESVGLNYFIVKR